MQWTIVEVSATFCTTLATGLTEYLVEDLGLSTAVAIERAYAEIDVWAGFDTRRTTPLAVNDAANASPLLTNALKAGFVAAGISQLTRTVGNGDPHTTFSSIGFIQVAYEDIKADGILDGIGNGGDPLSYGTLLITSDTYRTLLSTRLLQFVNSDYNQTGLGFSDLVGYAGQLNLYAGELFNYSEAQGFSETTPQIASASPSETETLKGSTLLSATVSDLFGIDTVEFLMDGVTVATLSQPPYIHELSTLSYQNGSHELEIIVTNILGNSESRIHNLNVYNGTISFTASSARINRVTINGAEYCPASIRVTDGIGLGIEYIKVDGVLRYHDESMPNGNLNVLTNHTKFESGTAYSNPRCPTHKIEVKDRLGNIHTTTYGLWWFGGSMNSEGYCYIDIGKCRY